jgi:hypothetical protein
MFISFPLDSFKFSFQECFQYANSRLLIYSKDEIIIITLLSDKQISRIRILSESGRGFMRAILSPDGDTLAVIYIDGSLTIFQPDTSESSFWKPWKPLQQFDSIKACSAFFKDSKNIIIGLADGHLCNLKVGAKPTKPIKLVDAPITMVSNFLIGCASGDIFNLKTGAKLATNSCLYPVILDSDAEYTLISKFNTIFLFHREKVVKEFHFEEPITVVGGSINPFLVCTSDGTLYTCKDNGENLVSVESYGGYKILGFVSDNNFKAMLASSSEENTLLISDNFTGPHTKYGKEYNETEQAVFDGQNVDSAAISYFLLGNRSIHLTEQSLLILKTIASAKKEGILQPELSKLLGIEAKMIFHHTKSLLKFGLITKYPVSSNKTFTYLNVHWRFVEEDFNIDYTNAQVHLSITGFTIQKLIIKALERAPNSILTSKDLFQQCNLETHMLKIFRRCLVVLAENGKIEYIRGSELGQRENLIRLKKFKENESAEIELEEEQEETEESIHVRGLPIGLQLYRYIASRGQSGVTAKEIMKSFGMNSKLANRLLDKFVGGKDPFGKDAIKQPEFFGKERRYKYMIRDCVCSSNTLKISPIADSPILGNAPSRDSITRVQRQELIINLLKEENGIIEVSKGLAVRMGSLLQTEHMIDVKTLKRYVSSLEEQGLLKTVVIKFPNISKHLAFLPSVTQKQIDDYVEDFKKSTRFGPSPIIIEEEANPPPQAELVPVDKFELGFIYGSMARLQYLHKYLLSVGKPDPQSDEIVVVDTITSLFRDLPLKAFSALCGFDQAEQSMIDFLRADGDGPVSNFNINTRRIRSVLEKLLALLFENHLIEDGISATTVPVTIRVKTQVDGYKFPEDFEEYWENLKLESTFPERFYSKPLSSRERKALRRENFERLTNIETEIEPQLKEFSDSLSQEAAAPTGLKQNLRVYSEEEDHELYVASLIGFHYRENYTCFVLGISKLPFRLIAISLYSPSSLSGLSQASIEVRRRIKNMAQNTVERIKVKTIEKNMFFIQAMLKIGLISIGDSTLNENSNILKGIANNEEENSLIVEFKTKVHFFLENLKKIDYLRELLGRYHESKPFDINKLQEIESSKPKSLLEELEIDSHFTRSELADFYYSKPYLQKETIHPDGFETLRNLIINEQDGQVPEHLLAYATERGYLIPSAPSRCDITINDRSFDIPSKLFFNPFHVEIPSHIEDIGDDSNLEGILTQMAMNRVRINPKTLKIDVYESENTRFDTLTFSWLTGRYDLLSSKERELIKDNLLKSEIIQNI